MSQKEKRLLTEEEINSLLEKNTEGDKRCILSRAVCDKFSEKDSQGYPISWAYLEDYDDEFVYWRKSKELFKSAYSFNGASATISDEKIKVVLMSQYEEVTEEKEASLLDKISNLLAKHFSPTKKEQVIIKQFDEEEMIAIEPLYVAIGDVDGIGDTYADPSVCYDMVKSFNEAIAEGKLSANYFHKINTDDFTILKAWVNEVDSVIGDSEVKEGMPLVKIKFNNEKAWELRKSGRLKGVSIGAKASWEEVE